MKKNMYIVSVMVLIAVLAVSGCKEEDEVVTPGTDTTIPNDVFPLTAGRVLSYSGYLTSQDTETPIAGTSTVYATTWSLGSAATPLSAVFGTSYGAYVASKNGGKSSGTLIMDTTTVPVGSSGATAKVPTPIFAYYDSTSKDYYYMTNLGQFFRSSVIKDSASASGVRMDSLRFIKLASPTVGIGGTFTCIEQIYTSFANPAAPTNITLKISGKWEGKQNVTVNGTTYSAYYVVITRSAMVGGSIVNSGVTAKLWMVQGVGPVKMFLAGNSEAPGNYRELKSKNF